MMLQVWLLPGVVTFTMASGVVTDLSRNPFAGLSGTQFQFTIGSGLSSPVLPAAIRIGGGVGACSYMLANGQHWFVCHDFEMCEVFLKPIGTECGQFSMVSRRISYGAKQQIENYAGNTWQFQHLLV